MDGCNQNIYNDYYTKNNTQYEDNIIRNESENNQQDDFNSSYYSLNPPENFIDYENFCSLEFNFYSQSTEDNKINTYNDNFRQNTINDSEDFEKFDYLCLDELQEKENIELYELTCTSLQINGNDIHKDSDTTNKFINQQYFNPQTTTSYNTNIYNNHIIQPEIANINCNFNSPQDLSENNRIQRGQYSLNTTSERKNTFPNNNNFLKKIRNRRRWTKYEECELLWFVLNIMNKSYTKKRIIHEYIKKYNINRPHGSILAKLNKIIGQEWNNKDQIKTEIKTRNIYNYNLDPLTHSSDEQTHTNSKEICKHAKLRSYQPTKNKDIRNRKWIRENNQFVKDCCLENKCCCKNWNQLSILVVERHPEIASVESIRLHMTKDIFPGQTYESFLKS